MLVQHAALKLMASIDAHQGVEDLLADALLHGSLNGSLDRVTSVPSVDELKAEREREKARTEGFTEEEAAADQMARIHAKLAGREERVAVRNADLVGRLISQNDFPAMLNLVDSTARAVRQVKGDRVLSLRGLWDEVAKQAPELLECLVNGIAVGPLGPLDDDLDAILGFWSTHEPTAVLAWVNWALSESRTGVRLAVANAFARSGWLDQSAGHVDAWNTGVHDDDETVSQAFLGTAGALLANDPASGAELVLANNISASAATRALERACEYDGKSFGAGLEPEPATSILSVMRRAGLDSYVVQGLLAGFALNHPHIALTYLTDLASDTEVWPSLPDDVYGLADAFETRPRQVADWIIQRISGDQDEMATLAVVLDCACGDRLGPQVARAVRERCIELTGEQLRWLAEAFDSLQGWGVQHRELAEAMIARARATDSLNEFVESFRYSGLRIGAYGWVNGVSEEVDALALAARSAAQETDDEALASEYAATAARLQAIKDELASEYSRDKEEAW